MTDTLLGIYDREKVAIADQLADLYAVDELYCSLHLQRGIIPEDRKHLIQIRRLAAGHPFGKHITRLADVLITSKSIRVNKGERMRKTLFQVFRPHMTRDTDAMSLLEDVLVSRIASLDQATELELRGEAQKMAKELFSTPPSRLVLQTVIMGIMSNRLKLGVWEYGSENLPTI